MTGPMCNACIVLANRKHMVTSHYDNEHSILAAISPNFIAVLDSIDAFAPSSKQFLNINTATVFAKFYKVNE
jgi:hypothetical protein